MLDDLNGDDVDDSSTAAVSSLQAQCTLAHALDPCKCVAE
jgi:hypothetical protein